MFSRPAFGRNWKQKKSALAILDCYHVEFWVNPSLIWVIWFQKLLHFKNLWNQLHRVRTTEDIWHSSLSRAIYAFEHILFVLKQDTQVKRFFFKLISVLSWPGPVRRNIWKDKMNTDRFHRNQTNLIPLWFLS